MGNKQEWIIKFGGVAIVHTKGFCDSKNFGALTWNRAYLGVCCVCKKPFPEYIKLQWKLLNNG